MLAGLGEARCLRDCGFDDDGGGGLGDYTMLLDAWGTQHDAGDSIHGYDEQADMTADGGPSGSSRTSLPAHRYADRGCVVQGAARAVEKSSTITGTSEHVAGGRARRRNVSKHLLT